MRSRRIVAAATAGLLALGGLTVGASAAQAEPVEDGPRLELFTEGGDPLGNSEVQPGDVITFKGSGFDPLANNPGGDGSDGVPIPNTQPQGVFIAFGAVADPWQPSLGASAEHRAQVRANSKWALLDSVVDALAEPLKTTIQAQSVTHNLDGTFEGQIVAAEPTKIPAGGQWGVYTYAGGAFVTNAEQELFVPVNFAASDEAPDTSEAPASGKELIWGFKDSWRSLVSGMASGTTTSGSGASIDDDGLFHFALDDATGYDPETGEGVLKYDGRIRFMSQNFGFDIVIEKPWITLTDGGTKAVLSLNMSNTATIGDLTVSRVDAAELSSVSHADSQNDGSAHRTWRQIPARFLSSIQPDYFVSFYDGEAADPLRFSLPLASDDDQGPGDEGNEGSEDSEQIGGENGDNLDSESGSGESGSEEDESAASAPSARGAAGDERAVLANTGGGDQSVAWRVVAALLFAGVILVGAQGLRMYRSRCIIR